MLDYTLSTFSIVLLEITIILIVIITFLIFKLRSITNKSMPQLTDSGKTSPLSYIEELTQHTKTKLKGLDSIKEVSLNTALTKRLKLLEFERTILKSPELKNHDTDYWGSFEKILASSDKTSSNKEQIYLSQISNLEKFKELFIETKQKLISSLLMIEDLKDLASQTPEPDQAMIEKINLLKDENLQLKHTVELTAHELDEVLKTVSDVGSLKDQNKLDSLKEGNEFLCTQIQHLLQQEVVASQQMLEDIDALKTALHDKEKECVSLTKQLS